mmetsp:Transcript_21966/g.74490  ORF Transcript_21966/g.74490 Transcript_21966/m.74490 type:complete len:294 (-) Transcript_21966:182-1063(-)
MQLALLALLVAAAGAAEPAAECKKQPLSAAATAVVQKHASAALTAKAAAQVVALVGAPCNLVNQGLIIMTFKMKNTAEPLGRFTQLLLGELEDKTVAEFWTLFPAEPRHWMLKSLIANLPCRVAAGASKCDEEETNVVLNKFESARFEFTQKQLGDAGMAPFPSDKDAGAAVEASEKKSPADEVKEAMSQYAARLGVDGAPAEWLVGEFTSKVAAGENATMVEPDWFRGIATRCRVRAHQHVPDVDTTDAETDLADLSTATRAAAWAWHYKNCHKLSVLAAFADKDAPARTEL